MLNYFILRYKTLYIQFWIELAFKSMMLIVIIQNLFEDKTLSFIFLNILVQTLKYSFTFIYDVQTNFMKRYLNDYSRLNMVENFAIGNLDNIL